MAKKEQPTQLKDLLVFHSEPKKAEGSGFLLFVGILCAVGFFLSLFTVNPILIFSSLLATFSCIIVSSSIQRSENMETYLHDIRDAINLQTQLLDKIRSSLSDGSDLRCAARLVPDIRTSLHTVRDIAEEARDLISYMQLEKDSEE